MAKKQETNAKRNGKSGARALRNQTHLVKYSTFSLHTELDVDNAISEIYGSLARGGADFDTSRLMLSALGKKLNLENLKVRAGFYKSAKARGFFRPLLESE